MQSIFSYRCQEYVPFSLLSLDKRNIRSTTILCYLCDLVLIWTTLYTKCYHKEVWYLIPFSNFSLDKRNIETCRHTICLGSILSDHIMIFTCTVKHSYKHIVANKTTMRRLCYQFELYAHS